MKINCYWSVKPPRGIPLIKNIIVTILPYCCLQGVTETCSHMCCSEMVVGKKEVKGVAEEEGE